MRKDVTTTDLDIKKSNAAKSMTTTYGEINFITLHDTAPLLIEEEHSALDDLKLKKDRQKMDEAHNRMIRKKYDLALLREAPALHREPDNRSPYDQVFNPRSQGPSAGQIQYVIDSSSLEDDEYRSAAKAYLKKVIPAAQAETVRLQAEVKKIKAEYSRTAAEYQKKIREAHKNLKVFNDEIRKEVRKFELANEGSRTPENFVIHSERLASIYSDGATVHWHDQDAAYKDLQSIQEFAERIDAYRNAVPDCEETINYLKSEAQNKVENKTGLREFIRTMVLS